MVVTLQRDIDAALDAAQCVVRVHERLVDFLAAGQTLAQIDAFVAQALADLDCRSAFLRYKVRGHPPFPSHACLSLNDCIVHGTHDMTREPIKRGDVLSIDIGVVHQGFVGDAAWTYGIEEVSETARRLMKCGREALRRGIPRLVAGRPLLDWAREVQQVAEKEWRFHLVRGLGGHGYGKELHGPPFVSNVVPSHPGEWADCFTRCKPGMLLAVEPMIAAGTHEIRSDRRDWPIFTADGSLAVHYEANVMVTEDGPRDLTDGMQDLPDIVG
jgi:methionyl aminopeptidase